MEGHFSKNDEKVMDGMDITLCCIDFEKNSLQYSGAYNPLYKIRGGELIEIKADKQPIGKIENRKPFTNHHINLNAGDCYYLFSDGLSDQFGGPRGKKFTYKQLQRVLIDNHDKPMVEQEQILDKTFEDWRGELAQVDDVCILGFKV